MPAELPTAASVTCSSLAVALNAALLALSVITIWFFFRRKRAAPRLYIALLVALLVATVIDVYAASTLVALAGAARSVGWSAARPRTVIWIAYFLTSERVRNTFTGSRASPQVEHDRGLAARVDARLRGLCARRDGPYAAPSRPTRSPEAGGRPASRNR